MPLTRIVTIVLVTACCVATYGQAQSSELAGLYPNRPVRMLVGTAPGGSVDIVGRIVGAALGEALGRPFVIDNRAGASGVIAADIVAHATPDGYTLLEAYSSHTTARYLFKSIPFDPIKSFTPITEWAKGPSVLVVNSSLPVKSVAELISYAKANPNKLDFGVPSTGSSGHLQTEYLKQMTGMNVTTVMFQGGGPGMVALLSGEVQSYFMPVPATLPYIKQGRLRALATTNKTRLSYLPDTSTMEELGYKGFDDIANWQGLLGPAGLPRAIVDRLYNESARALKLPEIRARLAQIGSEVIGSTPDEFAAKLKREGEQLGKIIKAAGMKPE